MGEKYDREFKIEAVKLASEPGNSQAQIEKDPDIGQGLISWWKKELAREGQFAFPGKGTIKPEDGKLTELRQELIR